MAAEEAEQTSQALHACLRSVNDDVARFRLAKIEEDALVWVVAIAFFEAPAAGPLIGDGAHRMRCFTQAPNPRCNSRQTLAQEPQGNRVLSPNSPPRICLPHRCGRIPVNKQNVLLSQLLSLERLEPRTAMLGHVLLDVAYAVEERPLSRRVETKPGSGVVCRFVCDTSQGSGC